MEDVVEDEDSAPCSAPNIPSKQPIYLLFHQADFKNYPDEYVASLAHVLTASEPTCYSQAANDPKWVEAMGKELQALEINDTWMLTELPERHKAISSKWVFKLKYLPDRTVDRYKARKYVLDLLKDAGLTASKPTHFPLPQNMKLSLDKCDLISDPESYRRLVGRLLYLSMTRPDISYVVQHLSQFVSSPKEPHLPDATHLLRYLEGSINNGLFYHVQSNLRVTGFSDADWASCLMTRKSSHTCSIANYIVCDNKAAHQIAANPCYHERTKHLDIDSHFTRDKGQEGFLQTAYIPTYLQLADIMTKALGGTQHSFLADKLGFQDVPT
ncbi:RNA-directed DNA polymerase [Tanacetum coccineum]